MFVSESSQARPTARLAAVVLAGLIAVLALWGPPGAAAKAKGAAARPAVKLKVLTGRQSAAAQGKVKVAVTGKRVKRQKVKLRLRAGVGKLVAAGGSKPRTVRKGRTATVTIKLSRAGREAVSACGTPRMKVLAESQVRRGRKGRAWKRSGRASRRLSPDASRCQPSPPPPPDEHPVPSTIDLSSAERCDFITQGSEPRTECLFPWPNDYFAKPDPSTPTGLRLNVSPLSTPANKDGKHMDPTDLNRSDGFSPGAPIVTQVPGLGTPEAFEASGIVSLKERSRYEDPDQPIVLIDAATGERQGIWAELDANATSPEQTTLLIHTNRNLLEGHRYIVAMRDLKRADGSTIEAPDGFRLYRDGLVTGNRVIESRRDHFESIFSTLAGAGIPRQSLYMAWDFTVASRQDLTGRMLHIRDDAFAQLGDHDLGDGVVEGHAPDFEVTDVTDFPLSPVPGSGQGVQNIRTVTGTFEVPCYLNQDGCPTGSTFQLGADGMPVRTPGNTMTARFTCNIPRSAVQDDGAGGIEVADQARPSLYGHGLFGDYTEVNATNVRQLGTENGVMVCGTDWSGMAEDDVIPTALNALQDLSRFSPLPDRLQQGFLNFLYLGRLLRTDDGFASSAAFRFGGEPVFDNDQLYYYGNSQGGIAGGALTAIAPDFRRSVLYVPGMRYSELLTRSVDFETYALVLYPSYPVERTRPLLLSMIQNLWDRGEPNGYALHMTDDPLPNTPSHKVLIVMAYGDHQVSNVTTEAEARTIGAPLRRPAIDEDRIQPGLIEPWFDMETLGDLSGPAADGNGMFVWDIGPKRMVGEDLFGTDPAPLTNTWPVTSERDDVTGEWSDGYGIDPHDTVIRSSPLAREQIAAFLQQDGKIIDPCEDHACYAAGWMGMP